MANHYTRQIPDLSEAQEQELQRWVRRAKTAQALVLRARIVLQTAAGKSDMEVAGQLWASGGGGFCAPAAMACWTSRARERRAR